ncbi:MAG: RNA methyltransferase tRNA(m5U54)methyltransferase [Sclerophora amabilis]|nr:MAG: RNA methyltransferase tRNA(m5U54)methyltransferase [Sclerophora amabilis]
MTRVHDSHENAPVSSNEEDTVDISVVPRHGQSICNDGRQYTTIKEGLAYILIPSDIVPPMASKSARDEQPAPQSVFYNPIQQFNRDLSVLAIRSFGRESTDAKKRDREQRAEKFGKRGKKRKRKEVDDTKESDPQIEVLNLDTVAEGGSHAKADASSVPVTGAADVVEEDSHAADEEKPAEQYQPSFRILDALSATGLRALRYAQEIPFVTSITANDISPEATRAIRLNARHNRLENRIHTTTTTAQAHMYSGHGSQHKPRAREPGTQKYDVIDLDPYGTAAPFLDAAVQAVSDGGLLCATCTDSGVFASVGHFEKSYALYGGAPLKGPHSHEGGLRLILHAIATSAARYGLAIEPLLSLSIDFYARVFVRVKRSPLQVKFLAGKTMIVYSCDSGCGAWTTQFLGRNHEHQSKKGGTYFKHSLAQAPSAPPNCEHCGSRTHLAGPMYGGLIHSASFVRRILDELPTLDEEIYATKSRIEGMLSTALEELALSGPAAGPNVADTDEASNPAATPPNDIDRQPFYFIPHAISKVFHCSTPPESALRGALMNLGYRVTRSHAAAGSIKTNAPWAAVWEIMREWVRQRAPIKEGSLKRTSVGWRIMYQGEEISGAASDSDKVGTTPLTMANPEAAGGVNHDVSLHSIALNHKAGDHVSAAAESGLTPPSKASKRLKVVFDEKLGARSIRDKRLVRYQINPRTNWGPMSRAKGPKGVGDEEVREERKDKDSGDGLPEEESGLGAGTREDVNANADTLAENGTTSETVDDLITLSPSPPSQ